MALSDQQRIALVDSLGPTPGEEGFKETPVESDEEQQRTRELLAPFIRNLDLVFRFQDSWAEWGFVIFRTTSYAPEHDAQWAEFRRRWDQIIQDQLIRHRGSLPKVDQAIQLLRFRWVEDAALQGASMADVARRYDEMDLPWGLSNSVCLVVTPTAMESVLNSPLPSSAPRRERPRIPFVVAVSRAAHVPPPVPADEDDDIAGADFKGYFNVAVESLLEELYPVVAIDITDLYKMTIRFRHEDDIWCSSHRWGVHRAQE